MGHDDTSLTRPTQSVAEWQLRHLVVPAPVAQDFNRRIDVVDEPGLDLLQGSE